MPKEKRKIVYRKNVNAAGVTFKFKFFMNNTLPKEIPNYLIEKEESNGLKTRIKVDVSLTHKLPSYFLPKGKFVYFSESAAYQRVGDAEYYIFYGKGGRVCLAFNYRARARKSEFFIISEEKNSPIFPNALFNSSVKKLYFVILPYYNTFILHSAGIAVNRYNKGVLLCGSSGSGKTTLSRRLGEPRYKVVSEECIAVHLSSERFKFSPMPWEMEYFPQNIPLSAIFFLTPSQTKHHRVIPLTQKELFFKLYANTFSLSPIGNRALSHIDLCSKLATQIRGYHLSHTLKDNGNPLELIGY